MQVDICGNSCKQKHFQNPNQGDQIGQFFACWAIIYFSLFIENYRRSPNFWATFSKGKIIVLIPKEYGLCYILRDLL
jgi:hypothetical protein